MNDHEKKEYEELSILSADELAREVMALRRRAERTEKISTEPVAPLDPGLSREAAWVELGERSHDALRLEILDMREHVARAIAAHDRAIKQVDKLVGELVILAAELGADQSFASALDRVRELRQAEGHLAEVTAWAQSLEATREQDL